MLPDVIKKIFFVICLTVCPVSSYSNLYNELLYKQERIYIVVGDAGLGSGRVATRRYFPLRYR